MGRTRTQPVEKVGSHYSPFLVERYNLNNIKYAVEVTLIMTFEAYPLHTLIPITVDNISQIQELGRIRLPDWVTGIKYSPDGKYLAVRHKSRIVLWDIHAWKEHLSLDHDGWWVETLAFSPDGKVLLTSAGSPFSPQTLGSTLRYWNIETGQVKSTWKPSVGFVNTVAFNPQNPDIIALISFERKPSPFSDRGIVISNVGIELWNQTSLIQRFFDFHQFYGEEYSQLNDRLLEFHSNGKTLFICVFSGNRHDGQVLAWEALGNGELRAVSELGECWYELTLDKMSNFLAISNAPEGKLFVRDLRLGEIIYSDTNTDQWPYKLEFDGTGDILAVHRNNKEGKNGRVDLISIRDGKTIREIFAEGVSGFAFSPDNTMLAIEMKQKSELGMSEIVLWGVPQ